ncbi:glycyl radical protein [Chloroflexota bacterium]
MVIDMTYTDIIKSPLVFDPGLKKPATERTAKLRDTIIGIKPRMFSERAMLITESMKETVGNPIAIRRAKALEKILGEMTILIKPLELIVGNQSPEPRGAPIFPEYGILHIIEELDGNPVRPDQRDGDRFLIDKTDEANIREIAKWWMGNTVEDYKLNLISDEVRQAAKQSAIFMSQGAGGAVGHWVVDYPKVLNKGLLGIIKEVEEELGNLKLWEARDFEKKHFLEAVVIALKAAINFGQRFSRMATEMAQKETDSVRKAELEKIAEHCVWVPANPPRTFWEAMQSLWFTHLIPQIESNGHSISFGRFDQYMYPFYKKDLDAGKITSRAALELMECLWIKSMEVNKYRPDSMTRRTAGYPMFQNLTLGGQTSDRRSAINDLSWLALEATANLKLPSPSISVRYWPGMPEDFLLKCLETINIHRGGQPALFNDEVIILAQLGEGVSIDEVWDYAINSCVQPCQPGKSMKIGLFQNHYNMLKVLEIAMNNGRDPVSGIQTHPNPGDKDLSSFTSFDELMEALKHQIKYYNQVSVSATNCVAKAFSELAPNPFVSALIDDCIKKGKDIHSGGGRYNTGGSLQIGMANVGNCLAALKKVLFDEQKLTPEQIMHALKTNFEDDTTSPSGADIQQILLNAPKYGNDDDYADLMVKEAFEFICKDMPNYVLYSTGARCNSNTATVAAQVAFGQYCGATPDGRKAGMPENDGVSPSQGTDVSGPTASLKSVAKFNHALCANGTLLNQKFNPVSFQNIKQLARIDSLVRTYFSLGGMHIQFNIISTETLRDAQKHPEKYPDLLVRVAGYSALFTTLDPSVQDEIISRSEQN